MGEGLKKEKNHKWNNPGIEGRSTIRPPLRTKEEGKERKEPIENASLE